MWKYNDELYHFGVKGMKWGVRHDPERQKSKQIYKDTKKDIRASQNKLYSDYTKANKFQKDLYKKGRKLNKQLYKSGKIDKQNYKEYKKNNIKQTRNASKQLEYQMAIGQYKYQKMQRANKALYYKDIYGENSNKYKKAKALVNRNRESWGNYTITNLGDNRYRVVAQYY